MSTLYLMRHGQSVINVENRLSCRRYDGDLTPLGREQAEKAARWLLNKGIAQIYCSPFHRAQQTAEIIAEQLGLAHTLDDDLCEIHCGDLEGRSDEEGWNAWRAVFERWLTGDWDALYPGGETYRQAYDRYTRCLQSIAQGETVLFVTHGGITCSVVPRLCPAITQPVSGLDNNAFVILEANSIGQYTCHAWNLTEHLAD